MEWHSGNIKEAYAGLHTKNERTTAPRTKMLRGCIQVHLLLQEIVHGEAVFIQTGCKVPADVGLIECRMLRTHESSQTGKCSSVKKQVKPVVVNSPRADIICWPYSDTAISKGRAADVATGMGKEIEKTDHIPLSADCGHGIRQHCSGN